MVVERKGERRNIKEERCTHRYEGITLRRIATGINAGRIQQRKLSKSNQREG